MSDSQTAPWPQLVLHVNRSEAQATEDALFAAGALSVTFLDKNDDPVLEPAPGEVRLWNELQAVALFAQGTGRREINDALCPLLEVDELPEGSFGLLHDQIWERAWMDRFEPMRFGDKLWICPTHHEPVDSSAVNLRLDPGLAFGSGTHATTALCLQWLDQANLSERHVLDFGCGSGVLAIAALLLGASQATATDIDPQAMQATRDNATLNQVGELLTLVTADELVNNQYDILIANILFQPLLELQPLFAKVLRPGAHIVLSGILREQATGLEAAYSRDFEFDEPEFMEDWVRLSGRRCR